MKAKIMSHIEEGRLHAYLDGQLPARERTEVEAHVAECAQCRARLDAAEELARASHAILSQVDPGPARPVPWREIESRGAARSRKPRRGVWLDPRLAWAATIALAFAVGWLARDVQVPADVGDVATRPLVRETTDSVEAFADESTLALKETEPSGAAESKLERPTTSSETAKAALSPPERERVDRVGDRAAAAPVRAADAAGGTPTPAAQTPTPAAEEGQFRRRSEEEEARRRVDEEARRRVDVARQEGERAYAAPMALRREADSLVLGAGVPLEEIRVHALYVEGVTAAEGAAFLAIEPSVAATWLGAPLRTLPGFTLERAEVAPGAAVRGGVGGLPAVRLLYRDEAGRTVTLLQQRIDSEDAARDTTPVLVVPPSGPNAYRWTDGDVVLTLSADLAADSLRALAARVR